MIFSTYCKHEKVLTVISYFLPVTMALPCFDHVTRGEGIPFASHRRMAPVPSKTSKLFSGTVTTGASETEKGIQ